MATADCSTRPAGWSAKRNGSLGRSPMASNGRATSWRNSLWRACVSNSSCFCARRFDGRTARSTGLSALWRTGAPAAGGLCSVTCCIWARSTIRRSLRGASRSRRSRRAPRARTLSLFPDDRCEGLIDDGSIVRLKLKEMRLCRPRTFGSCWLALTLWRELQLDRFWKDRLPASREGTRWDEVLFVLVAYRLLSPGSEWRLHREWFDRSALADLLGSDASLGEINTL